MKAVRILLIVGLMFTGQAVSFAGAPDPKDLQKLKLLAFSPPDKAPEFNLKNLDGKEVNLATYQGKPLMLYFWATW